MGSFDPRRHKPPMTDINVVPLVDVMLVLVVISIISTSLLTHSVKIDLPKATSSPNITRPAHIELGIREDGALNWNGANISMEALAPRFATEASKQLQPAAYPRRPPRALRSRRAGDGDSG